jgi:hypothetical protein
MLYIRFSNTDLLHILKKIAAQNCNLSLSTNRGPKSEQPAQPIGQLSQYAYCNKTNGNKMSFGAWPIIFDGERLKFSKCNQPLDCRVLNVKSSKR